MPNNTYPASRYVNPSMAKYIRDIETGKIPAPFKVSFFNTAGDVVSEQPIPCTPTGKPKIDLFSKIS